MIAYQINDGDILVVSVDGGAWETITFGAGDVQDPTAATPNELVNVINRSGTLASYLDARGYLMLATSTRGGLASLDIDLTHSTAAVPLGLAGRPHAQGSGLLPARLVSLVTERYSLSLGAEMTLVVDRLRRRITFDKGITAKKATAAEVVKVINARVKGTARVTRDGRLMLTSPTVGVDSSLAVEPGRVGQGKVDAASILGFVGAAAFSQPYEARPAEMACSGRRAGLRAVNLTASPLQFHFPTGTTVLPPRASLPLSPSEVAHAPLQRLIAQGVVRLESASED